MTAHRRNLVVAGVKINRVISTFANLYTTMSFEVLDQVDAIQRAISKGTVTTWDAPVINK